MKPGDHGEQIPSRSRWEAARVIVFSSFSLDRPRDLARTRVVSGRCFCPDGKPLSLCHWTTPSRYGSWSGSADGVMVGILAMVEIVGRLGC